MRTKANWLKGKGLWVQGCHPGILKVTRFKNEAVNGGKMMQE